MTILRILPHFTLTLRLARRSASHDPLFVDVQSKGDKHLGKEVKKQPRATEVRPRNTLCLRPQPSPLSCRHLLSMCPNRIHRASPAIHDSSNTAFSDFVLSFLFLPNSLPLPFLTLYAQPTLSLSPFGYLSFVLSSRFCLPCPYGPLYRRLAPKSATAWIALRQTHDCNPFPLFRFTSDPLPFASAQICVCHNLQRANILKEVQIMRGLDHPGIVQLVSFTESNQHYFLVLELM